MPSEFENSPVRSGGIEPWIEVGTIVGVNSKAFTVSWAADNSDKELDDLPILSPTFHQGFGEGLFCLPETGAKAVVVFPSDQTFPFIIGFYGDPEKQKPKQATQTAEAHEPTDGEVTFGAGRKPMQPGDVYYYGREGNFYYLKRDGTAAFGSGPTCQTMYLPLQNLLWHICKKYKIDAAGGQIFWDVKPSNNGDKKLTELRALIKEKSGAEKASVMCRVGRLPDAKKPDGDEQDHVIFELIASPEGINDKGESSRQKIVLRFDRNGNTYLFSKGTVTVEIKEKYSLSCRERELNIEQDDVVNVKGNRTINIDGDLTIRATNIKIEAQGNNSILGTVIKLGSEGASQAFIKGLDLVEWLSTHSHAFFGLPPTQAPGLIKILSKKVFGE